MSKTIAERIRKMNRTFLLPVAGVPEPPPVERQVQFSEVLGDEVSEFADIKGDKMDQLVNYADTLADVRVYIESEAAKFGIPLDDIVHLVIDSQESKLVDGKPVFAEDGSKFIKGPDYEPPEPKIRKLLEDRMER